VRFLAVCILAALPAAAHPSWGIVVDRAGRVTYSDLETIRRIGADGKPFVVRPGVDGRHIHELFVDPEGNVYGGDYTYENGRERTVLWQLAPSGRITMIPGIGVVRDRQGNTYAVEQNNHLKRETVIIRRTPAGKVVRVAGGAHGLADGTGAAARFSHIVGMTVTADGTLYVADHSAIRRVSPAGVVTTLARGLDADKEARQPLEFGELMGIAVGKDVYAADFRNRRVIRVAKGVVTTIMRSEPPYSPSGVAIAPNGDVWVLEYGFRPPGTWLPARVRKVPR
jgi:sugar lactone lactonase YvrE